MTGAGQPLATSRTLRPMARLFPLLLVLLAGIVFAIYGVLEWIRAFNQL